MNDSEAYNVFQTDTSSLLPGVSIDCVVIGFDLQELHILLLKLKEYDLWMLPGGTSYSAQKADRVHSAKNLF